MLEDAVDVSTVLEAVSTQQSPFEALLEYERLSLEHAAGAAEMAEAPGLWRGIGFRIGSRQFIAGITEVNEILFLPALTTVPGTKTWLLGVANIRGNLIPVVDLRNFVEGERTPIGDRSRVLVAKQTGGNIGLLVDEVLGQRNLTDENEPLESAEEDLRYARFVPRRYEIDGVTWEVFSMHSLIKASDFSQAAA